MKKMITKMLNFKMINLFDKEKLMFLFVIKQAIKLLIVLLFKLNIFNLFIIIILSYINLILNKLFIQNWI